MPPTTPARYRRPVLDHRPARQPRRRSYEIADIPLPAAGRVVRVEQADERILGEPAGQRIDGPQRQREHARIPIQIGHLDPVDTPSGQTARLNNLGYNAGSGGEAGRVQFEMAVQEFQVDNGLPVDGVCGPQTQAKLQETHGS